MARDRKNRQIRPPKRYGYINLVAYALSVAEDIEVQELCTYHEAITNGESAQWTIAISEEIESLHNNHTWNLVRPPKGQRIVGCKWVFKKIERILGGLISMKCFHLL